MHSGHRQRLYQKLKNGDTLYEHELLEMLLYNAYPRKDTNPIAHALLKRFPSMQAIFDADIHELTEVEGVGENVALYLKCVGLCTAGRKKSDCFGLIKNYSEFLEYVKMRLTGLSNEEVELYPVDKAGRILRIYSYTMNSPDKVEISPTDITAALSISKPYGLFVAHNHVKGAARPSEADDAFTKQLQLMCSMTNVKFYDHCIVAADGSVYSYFTEGRIDAIKNEYSIHNILK